MATYTNSAREYWNMYMDKDYGRSEGEEIGIIKGEKRGILKGRKEGKKEGRLTAIWEMAAKFLQLGVPIDDIAKATGLTPDQIRQI